MKLESIEGLEKDKSLKNSSQIKIGGTAKYFYAAKTRDQLTEVLKAAKEDGIEITVIGWGSNTLLGDFDGLVVVNKSSEIVINDEDEGTKPIEVVQNEEELMARLDQIQGGLYGEFSDLDYDESHFPTSKVYMDSGVSLPLAIYNTIKSGLTGLQWYGGIPGTIGGSVYNNIHGGTHFISEVVESVEILDLESLTEKTLNIDEIEPDYDYTNLQENRNLTILGVNLNLYKGDSKKAMEVMVEWRKRKKIQPNRSLGCMWKNVSNEDKERLGFESTSMGYVIDQKLNLKGKKIGGVKISDGHAAFMENDGTGTTEDVLALMNLIADECEENFGFTPKAEVFFEGIDISKYKRFLE